MVILLVFACKGKPVKEPEQEPGKDSIVPTAVASNSTPDSTAPETWYELYIPRAGFAKKDIAVSLQTYFYLPAKLKWDSSYYFEDNYLIVRQAGRKVADTLILDIDYYDPSDLTIVDMTDSLKFNPLLLQVNWRGNSDIESCQFIGYKGDSLKVLFDLDMVRKIKRKDANTLSGFYTSRDEVVYAFQDDYPFTVSLPGYEVNYETPSIQHIDYSSEVLTTFKAAKYSLQGPLMTIKKGTHLKVDSIYRDTKTVRLLVRDSIPVYIEIENLKEKISANIAG
jgi:hypothetical protein